MAKSDLLFLYLVEPYPLDVGIYPLSFLYLAWVVFLGYGNVLFIFHVPCWAMSLGRWQCLVYFPALYTCIVHDVCIYIYIFACSWLVVHLVRWTPMVRKVTLLWLWVLLTLWCGYAPKEFTVGAYSCHIVRIIIAIWLSRSMSAKWLWIPCVCDIH